MILADYFYSQISWINGKNFDLTWYYPFVAGEIILGLIVFYEVSWFQRRSTEKQIQKENQLLQIENSVMKEYYDTLENQLEQTRKFHHDIGKHMNVMNKIIGQLLKVES